MRRTLSCILSIVMILMFAYPINAQAASSHKTGALTGPPPEIIQPFTLFDPDYSYLERGGSYISELSDERINIWGDTYGTVHMDEIGVELTLQRWNGSSWVDVISGSPSVDTDSAYAYQSHILVSVAKGYYYRTKSSHWIIYGDTYEAGTRYSGSILLPLTK